MIVMNEEKIKWIFAKTYAKIAPHEYILQKDYPEFFQIMKAKIEEHGEDEPFTLFGHTKVYRYIYTQSHRYWIDEDVLNRDSTYGRETNLTEVGLKT